MKWITVGALITSTAAVCAVFLKNGLDAARSRGHRGSKSAQMSQELASTVANGIRGHAPDFDGLYEALYQADRDRKNFSTDAYEEWCIRAEHSDDEAFRAAFCALFSQSDIADEKLCREKIGSLLTCVAQAGVFRMQENGITYTADRAMRQAYQSLDGRKPEIGQTYIIIKSAWGSSTGTVEYGMVKPQQSGEGAGPS